MRRHTIEVSERELRAILAAMDYARERHGGWWLTTKYVCRLYDRLLRQGL